MTTRRIVTVEVRVAKDGNVYFGPALAGFVLRCPGEGPPGKPWVATIFGGRRPSSKSTWHVRRREAIDAIVNVA